MEDPNLILTLKATGEYAKYAFCRPHNSDRYLPPSHEVVDECINVSSREATPFTIPETEVDGEDCSHRIRLTFDQRPKNTQQGYVFGTDPRVCDVLLGNRGRNRVSNRHFCITFDEQKRVVLRDFSRWGTSVSYDGQARNQIRHHFTWIINLDHEKFNTKSIEVKVAGLEKFTFEIKLAEHKTCKDGYGMRLNSYLEESRTALPSFKMLGIHSQEATAAPTQPLSPGQRPIYVKSDELGRGEFGRVYRVIDVSTGLTFAGKTFLLDCQGEVEIMRRVSHERIVQFVDFTEEPVPMLVMEYLPLGNMRDQHEDSPITVEETITILHQGLTALEYLHSEGIAHRDIKPANILIQSRLPLCIKLADFGFAKDASVLQTWCGTCRYCAPEIWKGSTYTAAVDIWSLGLVIFEFAFGLPKQRGQFDPGRWYKRLIDAVEDWDSDDLIDFLRDKMLKMDYQRRSSASNCLKEVSNIHSAMLLEQNPEIEAEAPTEKISTSLLMRYANSIEEAETQIDDSKFNPPGKVEEESDPQGQPISLEKSRKRLRSSKSTSFGRQTVKRVLGGAQSEKSLESNARDLVAGETYAHKHEDRLIRGLNCDIHETSQLEHTMVSPTHFALTTTSGQPHQELRTPVEQPNQGSTRKCQQFFNRSPPLDRSSPQIARNLRVKNGHPLKESNVNGHAHREDDLAEMQVTDFDQEHAQMVVNNQAVLMRKSDSLICATHIFQLAGTVHWKRDALLGKLKKQTKVEINHGPKNIRKPNAWVKLEYGRKLCEHLGLEKVLQPLLICGSQTIGSQDDTGKYDNVFGENPEFFEVEAHGKRIAIRIKDFKVNASHLLKATKHRGSRCQMQKVKEKYDYIAFEYVHGMHFQGSYVDFEFGLQLCQVYGLAELEQQLRKARGMTSKTAIAHETISKEHPRRLEGTSFDDPLVEDRGSEITGQLSRSPLQTTPHLEAQGLSGRLRSSISSQSRDRPEDTSLQHPASNGSSGHDLGYEVWNSSPEKSHLSKVEPDLKPVTQTDSHDVTQYNWSPLASYAFLFE